MRTGQRVKFVAHPEEAPEAPSSTDWFYAHPDGLSDIPGQTWRQQLAAYNANPLDNSLDLLEACRLYRNPAYQELVAAFGLTNVFILSAAWGLVRADYLLPYYDLTFAHTKRGEGYKRRMQWDTYNDFSQLPNGENGPIVYFGGNNYLLLLKKVTSHIHCEKVIFFASANPPNDAQWRTIRFDRNFYNWHYACARDFIAGRLSITLLFEQGEVAHGAKRIVRVGTHTGTSQLRSRLRQHFLVENKDRSIFRKNVGRALLNRDHDPFLPTWELDRTSRLARETHIIDLARQSAIEALVSQYIQEHFTFIVFRVDDKTSQTYLKFQDWPI
jgi:hypothetical protein